MKINFSIKKFSVGSLKNGDYVYFENSGNCKCVGIIINLNYVFESGGIGFKVNWYNLSHHVYIREGDFFKFRFKRMATPEEIKLFIEHSPKN